MTTDVYRDKPSNANETNQAMLMWLNAYSLISFVLQYQSDHPLFWDNTDLLGDN